MKCLFIATMLSLLAATSQVEWIDPPVLIQEYNHVFKVKGNPTVISRGAAVVAADVRLS